MLPGGRSPQGRLAPASSAPRVSTPQGRMLPPLFFHFFFPLIYFSPTEVEVKTLKPEALKPSRLAPAVARPRRTRPCPLRGPGWAGRRGMGRGRGESQQRGLPGVTVTRGLCVGDRGAGRVKEQRRGVFSRAGKGRIPYARVGEGGRTAEVLFLREAIKLKLVALMRWEDSPVSLSLPLGAADGSSAGAARCPGRRSEHPRTLPHLPPHPRIPRAPRPARPRLAATSGAVGEGNSS